MFTSTFNSVKRIGGNTLSRGGSILDKMNQSATGRALVSGTAETLGFKSDFGKPVGSFLGLKETAQELAHLKPGIKDGLNNAKNLMEGGKLKAAGNALKTSG